MIAKQEVKQLIVTFVSSQVYACMSISNWVTMSEPHLIMLTCELHTIGTRAVSISVYVSLQIYA